MIERVQRVTLEGGEGSERERKGTHAPPSLRQDRLNDPLPLRHTEIKKRVEAWISLSWTASFFPSRCILLAYPRLHLPSIILHPLPVSLSVYRAPLLRLLFVRHVHTHAFSLFIRLEILVSPVPFSSWANLLLTFRRVSMSRGGNTRMAAMGGESAHWHLESVKQK